MKFKVAVVGGAGHIGLPLSCFIQNKGIQTISTVNGILTKYGNWSKSSCSKPSKARQIITPIKVSQTLESIFFFIRTK